MSEKGFSLIEVLVSVSLVGVIAVTFINTLGSSSSATMAVDNRETAKNLAETQMEYVKSQAYNVIYSPAPNPDEYNMYSVIIDAEPLQDVFIQKVTVTVNHQGKFVTRLEAYKVE